MAWLLWTASEKIILARFWACLCVWHMAFARIRHESGVFSSVVWFKESSSSKSVLALFCSRNKRAEAMGCYLAASEEGVQKKRVEPTKGGGGLLFKANPITLLKAIFEKQQKKQHSHLAGLAFFLTLLPFFLTLLFFLTLNLFLLTLGQKKGYQKFGTLFFDPSLFFLTHSPFFLTLPSLFFLTLEPFFLTLEPFFLTPPPFFFTLFFDPRAFFLDPLTIERGVAPQ